MLRPILLYPFGLIYGLIMAFRNMLYDFGVLKSTQFDFPVISIGNLTMGGTGKTPHVEFLIRHLSNKYKIAIISRGYGRKTKGFILADGNTTCREIGDEPMQYLRKFKNIVVAVDENRVRGIKQLKLIKPEVNLVICDDAYQHRRLKPGLSIMLSDFHKPFTKNYVFPAGTLREFRYGYKRSDIIIITKTDRVIPTLLRKIVESEIKPLAHQKLFFSHVTYGKHKPLTIAAKEYTKTGSENVLLFTGISNPYPFERHLTEEGYKIETLRFKDHHQYSQKDLKKIKDHFSGILGRNKIIITTEKDAMRLIKSTLMEIIQDIPVFFVPIEVKLHRPYSEQLGEIIHQMIDKHQKQLNLF